MKYLSIGQDQIPAIGLGTWKIDSEVAADVVFQAAEMGYRHFDCAWIYQNEEAVGEGLRRAMSELGIKREELWVTSKLWNDCHRPEHVDQALKGTLKSLQLDYLDLYLIHWPVAHQHGVVRPEGAADFLSLDEAPLIDTWEAMLRCQTAGLSKHVGVSNFSQKKLTHLIENSNQAPAVNQVESHPLLQQAALKPFCDQNDILFTAYSPLGSGDRPEMMVKESDPKLLDNPLINEIANARSLSAGEIMLAWAVNRGTIAIPKSQSKGHLQQNLGAADIQLTSDEISAIAGLDVHLRYVDGVFWESAAGPDGPYSVKELWDE